MVSKMIFSVLSCCSLTVGGHHLCYLLSMDFSSDLEKRVSGRILSALSRGADGAPRFTRDGGQG